MSTPFVFDYLRVAADDSDRPTDPVNNEPETSPDAIAFRFEADTQTLIFWDPVNAEYLEVSLGAGGSYTDEQAQDAIGAMVDTSLVYTDGTPLLQRAALTGAVTASVGSNTTALGSFTKAQLDSAVSDGNVLYVGDITQYTDEMVDDRVSALLVAGTNISLTYSDVGNTLTIARAYSGANVTMVNDQTAANYTSATAIAWDEEIEDVGGWHDNSSANTRLTVPAGITRVRITANVAVSLLTNDMFAGLFIYKGGNNVWKGGAAQRSELGSSTAFLSCSTGWVPVTPGEYFETFLTVETDTSVTILADISNFSIEGM